MALLRVVREQRTLSLSEREHWVVELLDCWWVVVWVVEPLIVAVLALVLVMVYVQFAEVVRSVLQ